MKITYTTSKSKTDLQQILELQQENLEISISSDEVSKEGFVTVHHDYELLAEMNQPFQHAIAKDKEKVIGYALVMLREMEQKIPLLIPMFKMINTIQYEGEHLQSTDYFIMGQVCIKKGYRGQGIFQGLYQELKKQMATHYKYIITEVATRNQRSIRAHQKVGFISIKIYITNKGEEWSILLWNIQSSASLE